MLFDNKYSDLHFYPGNSADKMSQTIALYLAWGREFTILFDGDKGGEDAKQRYLEEYGRILEGRVISLKDIDSSFSFATEKLFSEKERLEITQYHNPSMTSFHKKSFNKGLQSMYVEEHQFELEAETITRFEKIFEFIK